jgi:hypothetical protein
MLRHMAIRSTVVAAVVVVAGVYECASGHSKTPNTDETPLPVNIEAQNDLAVPAGLTVYIQEIPGKPRMLGDVPPAQTKTFSFTPASFGQPYRLIAERQLAPPLTSAQFTIDSPETGTVIWSVRTGIISFRTRATAETTAVSRGPIQARPDTTRDTTGAPR